MHPTWCDVEQCSAGPALHQSQLLFLAIVEPPSSLSVRLVQADPEFPSPWHEVLVGVDEYLLSIGQARILANTLIVLEDALSVAPSSNQFDCWEPNDGESQLLPTIDMLTMFVRLVPPIEGVAHQSAELIAIDDFLMSGQQARLLANALLRLTHIGSGGSLPVS